MLTPQQIQSIVKNFVSVCNQYLFYKESGCKNLTLGSYSGQLPATEEEIAKSFSMFSIDLWWTEEWDCLVMSQAHFNSRVEGKHEFNEDTLITSCILAALDQFNPSDWNIKAYPYLCFDTVEDMTPYYISKESGL